MKNLMKVFACGVVLSSLVGCAGYQDMLDNTISKNVVGDPLVIDFDQAWEEEYVSLESIIDEIRVVKLETKPGCLLSPYNDVFVSSDRIFLHDKINSRYVTIFSTQGNFVNRIHIGQGRKEFTAADDFFYDSKNKSLYVLDEKSQKIVSYTEDGEYKDVTRLSGWNTEAAPIDGGFLLGQSARTNRQREYLIARLNEKGDEIETWSVGKSSYNFYCQHFRNYDNGYIINKPYDNIIFYYKNGSVTYRYVFAGTCLGNHEILRDASVTTDDFSLMEDGKIYFSGHNYETDDYIVSQAYSKGVIEVFFFYNKNSDRAVRWTRKNGKTLMNFVQIEGRHCLGGNYLVGTLDPSHFNNWDGVNHNNLISAEDMEKLKSLNDEDNPLVVIFKLKSGL